jgi:FkbM family methyltransferase
MTDALEAAARSVATYFGPGRAAQLDAWYARFLGSGELAFDIGAHVGDRAACFARLGARVVAVEPQPLLARLVRAFGGPAVKVERCVLGDRQGQVTLRLNSANPTVATASAAFVRAAANAGGWEGQTWDGAMRVRQTTFAALAGKHGTPHFAKIDVEGHELAVLTGMTAPVRALSFEFTTIQRDVAHACVERLAALGYRHFNAALGETLEWTHPRPIGARAVTEWLAALPHAANSGDIYASVEPERLR